MKYGEARKLMFDEKEKEIILDLVKSTQEQIEKIPKSFFQININTLKTYQSQAQDLLINANKVLNSEFFKNTLKIAQQQVKTFESLNNKFLYTNRPIEYKAILPIRNNGEINEVKELKAKIDSLEDKLKLYKSRENNFEIEITPMGDFIYKGRKLCVGTNSNPGKFLERGLKNENNFISDQYCFDVLKCGQIKNIKRDLNNKYLKKDGLKAVVNRSGDKKGYVLSKIIEIKSL